MKVDLTAIDQSQFTLRSEIINGNVVFLVQPCHIGAKWSRANKVFRSSVWNTEGELISAGFPKFTNWGENPDNFPVPKSLDRCKVVEKMDGSLLIVSKYQGEYILRTRGTVDASNLNNGYELEEFKEEYLHRIESLFSGDTWNTSVLFEWTSPTQRIVINYGDTPNWTLVGAVHHDDYSLMLQGVLDELSHDIGLARPDTYTFDDTQDLLANVELWKGKEGVCVYSNGDQSIHKVKSADYLAKHRFKEHATLENTLEVFLSLGCPCYQEFEQKLIETFDYECFSMVRGFASAISDAWKEVVKIQDGMLNFVKETLLPMGDPQDKATRARQAEKVLASYGTTNRASFVFKLMCGKELGVDDEKKLLWQCLKR